MRVPFAVVLAATIALAAAAPAGASRYARYGIQDDAWLMSGPGTLEQRLDRLETLGVDLVRFNLRWDEIARRRPDEPRSAADPAYRWDAADPVLRGLRDRGIASVVTLLGTPSWANGGRSFSWAPRSGRDFGDFTAAAARRYPWVKDWLIWNEPNQRRWLRPTSPRTYVQTLLNPAYEELHRAIRGVRVGGGVTAPRGNVGGVSPVTWIRGMRAAGARLDAYAHHPYPLVPRSDTPTSGGCRHLKCETITMATLERLLDEVRRNFGAKRIWLTEYGYQTNPPDRSILGVSYATQARYVGESALRVFRAPRVDMLVHFLVQDDILPASWQSGLYTHTGKAKPASVAFRLPFAQVARQGTATTLWGQVRRRRGSQPYRLRLFRGGRWIWLGGLRRTNARGDFTVTVRAGRGARIQLWSTRDRLGGAPLSVR